jgi:hypothetical protein
MTSACVETLNSTPGSAIGLARSDRESPPDGPGTPQTSRCTGQDTGQGSEHARRDKCQALDYAKMLTAFADKSPTGKSRIKAVLEICQLKAPNATIILMGITPRNDNMAVMPIINRINENISKFADGRKIRFLNINDKLADKNGELFDGVANPDKLHLALKGYQIRADALKPIFMELLGAPAEINAAPPATGDPSAQSNPATPSSQK